MLIDLSNSIYYRQEDDFCDDEYTSVMSTGETEDYFLIKYCPLEFVQMDVRGAYDEEDIQNILSGKSAYGIFARPDSGKNKVIMTYRGCKYNKLWNIINYRNIWRKQKFSIDVFL